MMEFMKKYNFPLLARFILGAVFIYASFDKIVNPKDFSDTIDLYKATPISINNLIALIIPWVEFLIGFGLILNRSIKGSIILSISLTSSGDTKLRPSKMLAF